MDSRLVVGRITSAGLLGLVFVAWESPALVVAVWRSAVAKLEWLRVELLALLDLRHDRDVMRAPKGGS
jgi:hypothetical protein